MFQNQNKLKEKQANVQDKIEDEFENEKNSENLENVLSPTLNLLKDAKMVNLCIKNEDSQIFGLSKDNCFK